MKPLPTLSAICLILLAGVQAGAGDVFDAPGLRWSAGRANPGQAFSWKRHITFRRVTLSELTVAGAANPAASGQAISMGHLQGSVGTLDLPTVTTTVLRTVPSLWRLRVPVADEASAIDVAYEVEGANGHRDYLSHRDRPSSEIRVTAQPIPPMVIEHKDNFAFVEGGVTLYLDVANASAAGKYSGILTVTVHQL